MKIRLLAPFIIMTSLVLFVALACGTSTTIQPTNPPAISTQVVKPTIQIDIPTQLVLPTNPPAVPTQVIIPPTLLPPTPTPYPDYFTESFLGDLSLWPHNVTLGDETKFSDSQTGKGLRVELEDPDLYVYYLYDPITYQDVRLDLTYKNLAHNSNNINLVCRSSSDGWFEFTVQNDGLYQIWVYDGTGDDGYVMLSSGGSTAIRAGQQENEISATCVGNTLTLYINGSQVRRITDTRYFFSEGQIGFGVNISPNNPVTPVIVEFESLSISQP